jgi:hypothetical protein
MLLRRVKKGTHTVSAHPTLRFVFFLQLRRVYLPGSLATKFLQYAAANSAANRETCGILAGKLSGSDVRITHVLLPKQSGTSDSCAMTDAGEMDLLRYQVRVLCVQRGVKK